MKTLLPALFLSAFLVTFPVWGGPPSGKNAGNFPVREPDRDSPLYVVYEVLKAGVDTDHVVGFERYRSFCLEGRKGDSNALKELEKKEWENLREQSGAYLIHDIHGFKIWVLDMNPGPAYIKKQTKKVYITLRNQLEPEERRGLFIIERNKKGEWKLRSVNL